MPTALLGCLCWSRDNFFLMNVTIFKNISSTQAPFFRDVFHVLDRIKTGKSKEIVEKVREQKDKESRNVIKKLLPAICFCGTFTSRSDSAIIEHSGLICLDFDKYKDLKELKEYRTSITKDPYTFACFISPSGDGLKVLVKIPKDIKNHKGYFDALEKYYKSDNFDVTCKNISRVCYESYDKEIFINKDSKEWTEKIDHEYFDYREKSPTIKLDNESEIIKRLYVWFQKSYSMNEGARNNNLFILVSSFSDYGVSQTESIRFVSQFAAPDFKMTEIEKVVQSAYTKCKANFGMKYFEDTIALDSAKKLIKSGASTTEIKKAIPKIEDSLIQTLKEDPASNDFWRLSAKGGIIIENYLYKTWLEAHGFYKYYLDNGDNFIFVKVTNNLIDNTSEIKIKDFVLSELLKKKEYKVYEYFAANPRFFKDDYLNILDVTNVNFKEDTQDAAYIYFKNCAVEITKEKFNLIDYLDLNGFVWKKHIIDFEFKVSKNINCDFSKFIDLISNKDKNKVDAIACTLGYLMHSFKTSANNKAVILNDETISENPNGGSGKGIFWNALSKLKRVADINGKSFSFEKSFPYQTVSADTQILVFDDVQKNFKFENLFSIITEGITLEKKNKDAIKIPVNKSPKIIITTNYTLGGTGGSFDRRKYELEFSSYFSATHTPLKEFGRMLFDEWNYNEWLAFYNYMLTCIRLYLLNGLLDVDYKNLETRKFIKESSFEFYEWANEENLQHNTRLVKNDVYNAFIRDYPDWAKFKLSQKRFWQWVEKYTELHKFQLNKGQDSMGQRYIEIITDEKF